MHSKSHHDELIRHLASRQGISLPAAEGLLSEILAYFSEGRNDYIRRRHRELQDSGMNNRAIYRNVARELEDRRFPAEAVSERQIRRIIYG